MYNFIKLNPHEGDTWYKSSIIEESPMNTQPFQNPDSIHVWSIYLHVGISMG